MMYETKLFKKDLYWLERKPLIKNKRIWLCLSLAFTLKLASIVYLSSLAIQSAPQDGQGRMSVALGDTDQYLGSIENYIKTGEYYFWNGEKKIQASRLPHYGIPYYLLRQLVSKGTAGDLLVIIQIFIEALALIMLSLIGYRLFNTRLSFWLVYLISLASLNSTIYSMYLLPESFSISFLVMFLYFYGQSDLNESSLSLLWSGLFLSLLVVLKPYFVLLYVPLLFEIVKRSGWHFDKQVIKRVTMDGVAVSIFLILLVFPWVVRNYKVYGRFVPTQINMLAGIAYTEADLAFRRFAQAWGGSIINWDTRSAGCYFSPVKGVDCNYILPSYALAEGYDSSEVEDIRREYILLQQNPSASNIQSVAKRFDRLTEIYRMKRPFRYYLLSPLLLTSKFVFHSGSYYLPLKKEAGRYSLYGLLLKGSQTFLYYLTLLMGIIGLIVLTAKQQISVIFLFVPLFLIALFGFFLKGPEFRYFNHSYPLFIIGTAYCLQRLITEIGLRIGCRTSLL